MRLYVLTCLFAIASAVFGQAPHHWTDAEKKQEAEYVKQQFLHAWNSYRQYAWGHDELKPLSKQGQDWYTDSLLMTPVDALDTMILMGLKDQADEARRLIDDKLSFDKDMYVKAFEINIRLLGGLLSSYELTRDPKLLSLAEDLGNRLMPIFNSPTGMPYVEVNLLTGDARGVDTNPAEIGTYTLEFGTLSRLTGKPEYYEKAKRAVTELYKRRSALNLIGSAMNIQTGEWTRSTCHVLGGIDSCFEYLEKAWLLFGDKDCHSMWRSILPALDKYVADSQPSGFWYGEANMDTGERTGHFFGALGAFFPEILYLSGEPHKAQALEESCYKMWNLEGIEPELLDYSTMTITSPGYPLRPEIIESAFYLHFFTQKDRYLDMGKTFIDDLVKYCRNDTAFASLTDVRTKQQDDDMESFFFAETLKYCYLLFSPQNTLDLRKTVINTEAHPFQIGFKP